MNSDDAVIIYNEDVKPILRHSLCIVVAFWTAWMTGFWVLPFMAAVISSSQIAWKADLRIPPITGATVAENADNDDRNEVPLHIRELQMFILEGMIIVGHLAMQIAGVIGHFKLHSPGMRQKQMEVLTSRNGLWFLEAPSTVFRISFQVFVYTYVWFVQVHAVTNLFRMARTPIIRTLWRFETRQIVVPVLTIIVGYKSIKYLESLMAKIQIVHWFLVFTLAAVWIFCLLNAYSESNIALARSNDRAGHFLMLEVTKIQQLFGHVLRNILYSGFLLYHHLVPGSRNGVGIPAIIGGVSGMFENFYKPKEEINWIIYVDPFNLFFFAFASVQVVRFLKLEIQVFRTIQTINERNDDPLF